MCPVRRCRLLIRLLAATPLMRWLMPMHHMDRVAEDWAKVLATWTTVAAGIPVSWDTFSGV